MSGAFNCHGSAQDGSIILFDFNKPYDNTRRIHVLSSSTFDSKCLNPHGLSHWQNPRTGEVLLFVINHCPDGESIDVFEWIPNEYSLKHTASIQHPLISSPNDLLAVGPNSFYYTNDHYFNYRGFKSLESYLQISFASVRFYDGDTKEVTQVASSLCWPNGIAVSPDGRY